MRILADENIEDQTVTALREAGHDTLWVRDEQPRTPDPDVLGWATQESRLLLTYDKDFGEISQRRRQPAPYGIILFRISDDIPVRERAVLISQNVNAPAEWAGNLWVIAIRKRPVLGQLAAANLLQSP